MSNNKPTSIPYHRKHEAQAHNAAPRLEGVVKNKGIRPTGKRKKRVEKEVPEWMQRAQEAARSLDQK